MIVQEICRKSGCSIQVHEEELRWNIRYYKDHNKCHCNFVVFLQNQIREDTNWIKCSHSIEGKPTAHVLDIHTDQSYLHFSNHNVYWLLFVFVHWPFQWFASYKPHIYRCLLRRFLVLCFREDWASWYHRYGYRGSWLGLVRTRAIKLIPWWWRKSNKLAITESAY